LFIFIDALPLGMIVKWMSGELGYLITFYIVFVFLFRLVDVAIAELEKSGRKGEAPHDAWNHAAVYLIKAAQAHARLFVVESFVNSLKVGNLSAPVRTVLSQLCELFIIYWLLERSGDFFLVRRYEIC
jgi:hypothetical protein